MEQNIYPNYFYTAYTIVGWDGSIEGLALAELLASHWLKTFDHITQKILSFFTWNKK